VARGVKILSRGVSRNANSSQPGGWRKMSNRSGNRYAKGAGLREQGESSVGMGHPRRQGFEQGGGDTLRKEFRRGKGSALEIEFFGIKSQKNILRDRGRAGPRERKNTDWGGDQSDETQERLIGEVGRARRSSAGFKNSRALCHAFAGQSQNSRCRGLR